MKYFLKTLKHRTPLLYLSGVFLSTPIFIIVKLLDSEYTKNFHYWYISLLYIALIPTFIGQYKLISGKWNFNRYISKMILLNAIPFSILLAFIGSQIPKYSLIAIVMLIIGFSIASGLYTLKDFSISGIAYTVSYLLFILFEDLTINRNTFLIHFLPIVLLWLAILGVGLSSNYYVKQNKIMAFLLRNSRKDKRTISEERRKSDMLLLNILPKEIAETLKKQEGIIADHFARVTVLFADIVNFTPMSARMSPNALVELLNEVFSRFDLLVEKYNLEKIKTIGDCYMVASGVPRQREDHAHAITNMALDIREVVENEVFGGRKLDFRIGINSGPAVAGVIGNKKFIYDMWGDTVNTASRMESHGRSGVIQVTESTYDLIKDCFLCEPMGSIDVKGLGEVKVWHVQGRR